MIKMGLKLWLSIPNHNVFSDLDLNHPGRRYRDFRFDTTELGALFLLGKNRRTLILPRATSKKSAHLEILKYVKKPVVTHYLQFLTQLGII